MKHLHIMLNTYWMPRTDQYNAMLAARVENLIAL